MANSKKKNQENNSAIAAERLRQNRWSFNLLVGLLLASSTLSLGGFILLFLGKIPVGTATTTVGMGANLALVRKLHKDTSDRLSKNY